MAMEGWREIDALDSAPPETPLHRAKVEVRQTGREAPVRWEGEFLGFAEAMGETIPGILHLTEGALILWTGKAGEGGSDGGNSTQTWPLLEIRAVQTSSSSLQFSPSSGGLVQFRFPADSPFRWETLLRHALRKAYQREGLGEIVEFQPRIVSE